MPYKDPEKRHIVALNSGGDGEWDNLTPACRSCNASKNDRSLLMYLYNISPAGE